MNNDLADFKEFMIRRGDAASAYVSGNALPLGEVVTHTSAATFFGPGGGNVQGAAEVWQRYDKDSVSFKPGGESSFEILQIEANGGIGYWVGFQKAKVHLHGRSEPVEMELRVTEIFRRENDGWKMVHRHADTLIEEKGPGS
jgi:ketosteroid isomerase-like protein